MAQWTVEDVVCDYGVFEDGELKLITNSRGTAEKIVELLEEDERIHRELNPINFGDWNGDNPSVSHTLDSSLYTREPEGEPDGVLPAESVGVIEV